jgi:SAM-dependent methyltransferase
LLKYDATMTLWTSEEALRSKYVSVVTRRVAEQIPADHATHACNMGWARNRITEGFELARHFEREFKGSPLVILDVGSGDGGVSLGLANERHHLVIAVDVVARQTIPEVRAATGVPLHHVVADASRLPFRTGTLDVVLCLDTFEHLSNVRSAGSEMMRVLRSRGQVMITTPARLRYLWRPDPHFGIRGLLALPNRLQKYVVTRLARCVTEYNVVHTFWTAWAIARCFPGRCRSEALVAIPPPGRPRNLREVMWKLLRHLLWDRIIFVKR